MTTVHALELGRLGVRVNCIVPSMVRTRLTLKVPGMDQAPPVDGPDPKDPAAIAPVVSYLVSSDCPLTGQTLAVRGGTVSTSRGWTLGERVHKDHEAWTVPELAQHLEALQLDDPFEHLAVALGTALGSQGREALQAMISAELDKP
jgi:hypothetical protein